MPIGDSFKCKDLNGAKMDYCVALSRICKSQMDKGASSFTIKLSDEKIEHLDSYDDCLDLAHFIASLGVPKSPTHTSPVHKKKLPLKKRKESPKQLASKCKKAGKEDSPEYIACKKIISSCEHPNKKGKYVLPFTTTSDKDDCIDLAIFYGKTSKSSTPKKTNDPTTKEDIEWKADGKTKFAASFARTGFKIEKSQKIHSKDITMLFNYDGAIKGVKIKIYYKLINKETGSYALKYKIFYINDKPKDINETDLTEEILLNTNDDTMNTPLAFCVTLKQTGNFSSIKSIKILKL